MISSVQPRHAANASGRFRYGHAGYCLVVSDNDERSQPDVSFAFDCEPHAPRAARRAIAPLLHENGRFAEDVQLATSEMVTNVVEHTHDGGRLEAWDDDPLLIEVEDFNAITPTVPAVPAERGGRGLAIVTHVADDWGVVPTELGKIVWAKFRRPRPPDADRPASTR